MRNHLFLSFWILTLAGYCSSQTQGNNLHPPTIWSIVGVLQSGHLSGSLEYWGRCDDEHRLPDLPNIPTPKTYSGSPLQVLREMFGNDKKMQVTQQADGTIRMVETDAPRDLLNVKIAHISFDEESKKWGEWFSARNVQRFILGAPEVVAFMKDQSIGRTGTLINEVVVPGPSISGELNDVTLSEAFDYMLKTFPGLWVYENCPGNKEKKRLVVFTFYSTAGS